MLVTYLSPLLGIVPEDLLQSWPGSQNIVPLVLDRDQQAMMEASVLAFLQREDARDKKVIQMIPRAFLSELGVEVSFDGSFLETIAGTVASEVPGAAVQVVHDVDQLRSALSP